MDALSPFTKFMSGIAGDARIGSTHIALFMAVYGLWLENGRPESLALPVKQVMKKAKILARSTYVRGIQDLGDWGYLVYLPSYNNRRMSRVILKNLNDGDRNCEQTGFDRIQERIDL